MSFTLHLSLVKANRVLPAAFLRRYYSCGCCCLTSRFECSWRFTPSPTSLASSSTTSTSPLQRNIASPQQRGLLRSITSRHWDSSRSAHYHFSLSHARFFASSGIMAQEYKLKDIASLADIKPNDKVESEVEGVPDGKVLVLKFDGEVHALSPRCTHYGAPLKLGVVAPDGRITCPWHGGEIFFKLTIPPPFFRFGAICKIRKRNIIIPAINSLQHASISVAEMSRTRQLSTP